MENTSSSSASIHDRAQKSLFDGAYCAILFELIAIMVKELKDSFRELDDAVEPLSSSDFDPALTLGQLLPFAIRKVGGRHGIDWDLGELENIFTFEYIAAQVRTINNPGDFALGRLIYDSVTRDTSCDMVTGGVNEEGFYEFSGDGYARVSVGISKKKTGK